MAGGAGGHEVGRISIRVVPDLDKFYSELKAKLEEVEKVLKGKVKISADFDSNGLREKVDAAAKDAKVNVKADVDQSSFDAALARVKAAAKVADAKVNVKVEDKMAEASLAASIAKLKAEAKAANIKVKVDVDSNRLRSGMADALGGLFAGGARAGGGGVGVFGSFIDTAALVAAVAAIFAPALALISGALLALPPIIAGVVLPLGTLALGFRGIQKAAEAAGLLGEGKKGKTGIGPSLKALQDTLSQKFQDGFTPIFQKLAPLIPAVGNALLPIADRLIGMAQGLTDVVTSSSGMRALQSTIDGISNAMQVATPGLTKFSEGMLNLIGGGAKSLPGFAQLFTNMGTSFSDWITKISTPDKMIGKAFTSPLDRAMSNLQGVLKEFGGLVGDLFTKGFEMLADPQFGASMKGFVADVRSLVNDSLPALKQLFIDIAGAVKDISGFVNTLANFQEPGWMKFFSNNNQGASGGPGKSLLLPEAPSNFANLLSAANPLLLLLNQLRDGNMWAGVGQNIANAFSSIGTTLQGVGQQILTFFTNLPQTISGLLAGIPGAISGIWDGVVAEAQNAWAGVIGVIQGVIGQIIAIVTNIAGAISGTWQGIVAEAQSAWDSIVASVSGAASNIVSTFSNAASQVLSVFQALPGQMAGIGAAIVDGLANGIASAGARAVAAAQAIASQVAGALKGVLGINSPSKVTQGFGVNLMEGLQNGMEDGSASVIDRAKALAQQISDALKAGMDPSIFKGQLQQINDELNVQRDQLKIQLDQTPKADVAGRQSLRDQLAQIGAVKDQLNLQRDQAKLVTDQADGQSEITKQLGDQLTKLITIGENFAMSNVKQFENDIGISGNGAIPTIAEAGLGWLTSTLGNMVSSAFSPRQNNGVTINVSSADEAMAIRQNMLNKQAMQYAGR